jgi:DNA-binding NarL/FixJ family response regulator
VAKEPSAKSLISAAKDQRADVLILDSYRLDKNDLQFILGARAFGDFAVVLLYTEEDQELFVDAPVDKLVPRSAGPDRLYDALGELGGKVRIVRPYVREGRRPYGGYSNSLDLSRREYEVAQLVAKGMSNRKISVVTGLREQSVKNLVSVIMRKLRCENRVQVALRLTQGAPVEETDPRAE